MAGQLLLGWKGQRDRGREVCKEAGAGGGEELPAMCSPVLGGQRAKTGRCRGPVCDFPSDHSAEEGDAQSPVGNERGSYTGLTVPEERMFSRNTRGEVGSKRGLVARRRCWHPRLETGPRGREQPPSLPTWTELTPCQ